MKTGMLVMIGAFVCAPVYAQAPDAGQQPPPAAARPAPAVDPRRDDIRTMETVLTQALQKGAQDLARQLKLSEPNSAFVTGTGRARGFILEGYGVFFDVDVPGMKYSVVWSAQMVQLVQDRERALQIVATTRPDDPLRRIAEGQVKQIDRLMAAAQAGAVLVPSPVAPTQLVSSEASRVVPRDRVEAVAVADVAAPPAAPPAPPAATPAPAAPAAARTVPEIRDPNELYTESVKNALIDAMLKYSSFLKIADNEWLTVAASDSDGPQVPGQLDDASRIVIRVKGNDLAAFQSGKITPEEVRKRVEVREY